MAESLDQLTNPEPGHAATGQSTRLSLPARIFSGLDSYLPRTPPDNSEESKDLSKLQ